MIPIELRTSPFGGSRQLITAKMGHEIVGILDYLPQLNQDGPVKLGLINVVPLLRGQGISKLLLKEFVRQNGREVSVSAVVTHAETHEYLQKQDLNQSETGWEETIIKSMPSILAIPFAKILSASEIDVIQFVVTTNPKSSSQKINKVGMLGLTR